MIKKSTPVKSKKSQLKQQFAPKQSTINFLLSFASVYQATTIQGSNQVCDFILN